MDMFQKIPAVIGMIHLPPLPGSPHFGGDIGQCIEWTRNDYHALKEGGITAVLIENFWDVPYFKTSVGPETITWMTKIISSLHIDIPFGVNVLRNDSHAALAIAHATGGSFIRCNVLSGALLTDQGIIEGKSASLMRYRTHLSPQIKIYADVLVKHAYPLASLSLEDAALDTAYRALADALIVTGTRTGGQPFIEDVEIVKKAVPDRPLLAGSGVTLENMDSFLGLVDGFIVGTAFKAEGHIKNHVDQWRVKEFMKKCEAFTH
jgi:hypothetical protein